MISWNGNGILIKTNNNTIENNYIGLNGYGDNSEIVGNSKDGILIEGGNYNIITKNYIGSNEDDGISVDSGANNYIIDNVIGLLPDSNQAFGNNDNGIEVTSSGATIMRNNTISGNGENGIKLLPGSANWVIEANIIGLDTSGTVARGNAYAGIYVMSTSGTIGSASGSTTDLNLITGNGEYGIFVHPVASGVSIPFNMIGFTSGFTSTIKSHRLAGIGLAGSGCTVGTNTFGNIVVASLGHGVWILPNSTFNILLTNFIGTDGYVAFGNDGNGVQIDGNYNQVGSSGTKSVISANSNGIMINGHSNTVRNCIIGLNAAQNASMPNTNGIVITSYNNTVGLPGSTGNNIVSGNTNYGILLTSTAQHNTVAHNLVGVTETPEINFGNRYAIVVQGNNNTVGDVSDSNTNVAGSSSLYGIQVDGNYNQIINNYVGIHLNGSLASNIKSGIFVLGHHNTIDGGLVSGNGEHGVYLSTTATKNIVSYATIGLNSKTSASYSVPNNGNGVMVLGPDNMIGPSNVIGGNNGSGVYIAGSSNTVQLNSIGSNNSLPFPNAVSGIVVYSSNNLIGGLSLGNTINSNVAQGIHLASNATHNIVLDNKVGFEGSSSRSITRAVTLLGNGIHGVFIQGSNNTLGDNSTAGANIIGGIFFFNFRLSWLS